MSCKTQEMVYLDRGDNIWNTTRYSVRTDIIFPNSGQLYLPILLAGLMLIVRNFMERYCFAPLGVYLGIKDSRFKKAPSNGVLETAYSINTNINHKEIQGLAKQLDWTKRKVEMWLRKRQNQDKSSILVKFCGSAWKTLYYSIIFVYGFTVLWDKPWFWDINECWYTYPHQSVDWSIWSYFMLSLTYYWAACFTHFYDAKRKDFWQMFIHHAAAIALMNVSWMSNLVRIGSLVLVVHYCVDVFLQGAKMAKYVGYPKISNFMFGMFTIVWIITRLGVYPMWIMYSAYSVTPNIVKYPVYYSMNGLLALLLVLHIIWTYTIFQILVKSLKEGKTVDDIRSDSSCCSDDNDD